jgi:hypothetical protein
MSDIGYAIESNRRTAWDKLHITQLLPTRYSINITNAFSGYQYSKQLCMYVYEVHFWLNIHLMYARIRWITDQIFTPCMNGSGGLQTEYSVGVSRNLMDCQPNIHSMYAGVRWMSDQIFIQCMQGSGRWLTKYSFDVYGDPADYALNIHSVYARIRWITDWIFIWCMNGSGRLGYLPNIHLVYAGIWWMIDSIFILCMQGSSKLPTQYSFGIWMG